MNVLSDTYFDLLPSELILKMIPEVISKEFETNFDLTKDLINFGNTSYKTKKIFNKKSTWKFLINKYLAEYNEIIQKELTSNKKFTSHEYLILFTDLYLYHMYKRIGTNNISNNITFKYKIKKEFPVLFYIVKTFNFSKGGFKGKIKYINRKNYLNVKDKIEKCDKYAPWHCLYKSLNYFKNEDEPQVINFLNTGEIPNDYVYYGTDYCESYMSYIVYSLFLSTNFNIEIQYNLTLYYIILSSFMYNFNIYEKLCKKISKSKLIEIFQDIEIREQILDIINYRQNDFDKQLIKNMLSDINEKININ